MRNRGKVDANQNDIVEALRAVGATVEPCLAKLGKGVPDLLVGFNRRTFLMEVKNPEGSPSSRRLTDDQVKWHRKWRGSPPAVVECVADALFVIGAKWDPGKAA